jgi:hypothetical protein
LRVKRKRIIETLPLHLRDAKPEALHLAGHPQAAEGLLDVEWRLSQVPAAPVGRKENEPWQECINPERLRRRLHRYEQRLQAAGGRYSAPEGEAQWSTIEQMRERVHLLEWEEYDQRMTTWTMGATAQELARPRPQASRTKAERALRAGQRPGRRPGSTAIGSTKPKRPSWLKEQDDQQWREQREQARCTMRTKPVPEHDRHERAMRRKETTLLRRQARKAGHARARIEAQALKVTEWIWGEGVAWGVELPLDDGWIYCDTERIPYARQRAAALKLCAVPVTGGWCFPPRGLSAGG